MATYRTVSEIRRLIGCKLPIFPASFHLAPSIAVTPLEFHKPLKNPDTRILRGADSEDVMILACIVLIQYWSVIDRHTHTHTQRERERETDRQTDRQTDGRLCDS